MKKDIHPQYWPTAIVKCACGNSFTVGSTVAKMEVEVCSACHPFFTGKAKIIDTAGRVEKFRARQSRQSQAVPKIKTQAKINSKPQVKNKKTLAKPKTETKNQTNV